MASEFAGVLGDDIDSKVDPTLSTGNLKRALTTIVPVYKTSQGWAVGIGPWSLVGDPNASPPPNTIGDFLSWLATAVEAGDPEALAAQEAIWTGAAEARAERARQKAEVEKREADIQRMSREAQAERLAQETAAAARSRAIREEARRAVAARETTKLRQWGTLMQQFRTSRVRELSHQQTSIDVLVDRISSDVRTLMIMEGAVRSLERQIATITQGPGTDFEKLIASRPQRYQREDFQNKIRNRRTALALQRTALQQLRDYPWR